MMNETEKNIFSAIESFWFEHGYSPSLTELEEQTFYSRSTVRHSIRTLEEKGYLEVDRQVRRNIRLRDMSNIINEVRNNINNTNHMISANAVMDILTILHKELTNNSGNENVI